jgi:hypothetical protein
VHFLASTKQEKHHFTIFALYFQSQRL